MTGKIFENSSNIYQDQAKILFNYYKNAAEAIVSAQMNEEQNKADLIKQRDEAVSSFKKTKTLLIISFIAAGIGLLLTFVYPLFAAVFLGGLVFGIINVINNQKAKKSTEDFERLIVESDERYANIRMDYKVDKIGVVYVPVATRVPFEDQSFVLDHTGETRETGFKLTVLRQPDEFQDSVRQLTETLNTLPVVEDNSQTEAVNTAEYSTSVQSLTLNDYMGNIDRQVRNISFLLGDNDDVSVNIPVITPQSNTANYLRDYATDDINGHPVVKVFDVSFEDRLKKFASLNALKDQIKNSDDADSNEYMKHLMQKIAESVQLFTQTKVSGSSKLADYTTSILNTVLKAGYTQYSPNLEAEEIERVRSADYDYRTSVNEYTPFSLKASSIVKYELFSKSWIAEDGSRTSMPFGMHQIDEEIFMPIITDLMEETRVERLKIYNSIEDQKRMYLERWSSETGNYFRDNRKTADELITHMRETYADYMNAYNMYKSLTDTSGVMKQSGRLEDGEVKEMDSQAEMIAGFEAQAAQCNQQQEEFAEFMDRIQENIEMSTREFSHIEYYEGSLRDTVPHETAVAFSNIHGFDYRHRKLVNINPYVASRAELPPEPITNPEIMEHVSIDLIKQVEDDVGQAVANSSDHTEYPTDITDQEKIPVMV